MVGGLAWFWVWQGHSAEIRATIVRLLGSLDDAVPTDRLQLQFCDTWTAVHSTAGHHDIEAAYERWMNDADRLGDLRHAAMARVVRGSHTAFLDPPAARVLIQEGLDSCEAIGEKFWSIYAEGAMALSWIMVERMDEADGVLERMERRSRSLGHPQLIADAVSRRAFVDHALGRYGALESGCREVESDFARISTGNLTAVPRSILISVEVSRGRASAHEAAAHAMLTAYLRSGERQHVSVILGALADVAIGLGRADEVSSLLNVLAAAGDELDDYPFFRVRIRHRRALAAVAIDDRHGARALLDAAMADCSAIGNRLSAARTNVLLAFLDRRDGEHRRAFDRALAAIGLAEPMGAVQIGASAVEVLAALSADAGRPEVAARLLGVGWRIRATGGITVRLAWQADHDQVVGAVRPSSVMDTTPHLPRERHSRWVRRPPWPIDSEARVRDPRPDGTVSPPPRRSSSTSPRWVGQTQRSPPSCS